MIHERTQIRDWMICIESGYPDGYGIYHDGCDAFGDVYDGRCNYCYARVPEDVLFLAVMLGANKKMLG